MILDTHGIALDPYWCAEFCGFFIGEGNLEIGQLTRVDRGRRSTFLRPRARLIQRDDNRPILEEVCGRLGGHVTGHKSRKMVSGGNGKTYINHPQIVWQVTSTAGVSLVLDILETGRFPHSKYREVAVLRRFLALRSGPGHKVAPETYSAMFALKAELESLRTYTGC